MTNAYASEGRVGRAIVASLAQVWGGCLPTGEIPMWRSDPLEPSGGRIIASNNLASALVHDTLACFDPSDLEAEPRCLLAVSPRLRQGVVLCAQSVRHQIRRFLAWHESARGAWCFYGRGSGLPGDSPTTACAAVSLLAGSGPRRWSAARHDWIAAHQSAEGSFHTWLFGDRAEAARYGAAGYGSRDVEGQPLLPSDRVFNAHILRFAYYYGMDRDARERLLTWLAAEASKDDTLGSVHHPKPLCFDHALARALRASFPEVSREQLVDPLCARILARRDARGWFGGPLSTALAVLALLDLGRGEVLGHETLIALCDSVLEPTRPQAPEPYLVGDLGSRPFNLAHVAAALARLSVLVPAEATG
ncbi:MAG: hypothetical protein R6X02_09315 [Enhygromyxa sp.]